MEPLLAAVSSIAVGVIIHIICIWIDQHLNR